MKLSTTGTRMLAVTAVGIGAVALIGGTATAASLVTAKQMATGSVNSRVLQDESVRQHDLTAHAKALLNKDNDSFSGAVYRVENYTNGGGGDATVACASNEATSKKYTAIAGGVEAGHTGTNDFSVAASFPGRMDWNTGTRKSGRLDGWIVLGNGQHTGNLKVWALCVPTTSIPVQQVDLAN
jgi:hypothetical protein